MTTNKAVKLSKPWLFCTQESDRVYKWVLGRAQQGDACNAVGTFPDTQLIKICFLNEKILEQEKGVEVTVSEKKNKSSYDFGNT